MTHQIHPFGGYPARAIPSKIWAFTKFDLAGNLSLASMARCLSADPGNLKGRKVNYCQSSKQATKSTVMDPIGSRSAKWRALS